MIKKNHLYSIFQNDGTQISVRRTKINLNITSASASASPRNILYIGF